MPRLHTSRCVLYRPVGIVDPLVLLKTRWSFLTRGRPSLAGACLPRRVPRYPTSPQGISVMDSHFYCLYFTYSRKGQAVAVCTPDWDTCMAKQCTGHPRNAPDYPPLEIRRAFSRGRNTVLRRLNYCSSWLSCLVQNPANGAKGVPFWKSSLTACTCVGGHVFEGRRSLGQRCATQRV